MLTIKDRLAAILKTMKDYGIEGKELAALAGIDASYFSRWREKRNVPRTKMLDRVEKALQEYLDSH